MFQTRMKTHHSAMAQGKEYALGPKNVGQILKEEPITTSNNGTIYIHVPFCKKICSFCNMRRSLSDPKTGYGHTIVKETCKNHNMLFGPDACFSYMHKFEEKTSYEQLSFPWL